MSILIKGMEMPKTGEYRCVIRKWQQGGTITIDLYGEEELCGTIVPVPPHGRLIDADAVSLEGGPYEYDEWCKWALEQYQDAPTVIPADKDGET